MENTRLDRRAGVLASQRRTGFIFGLQAGCTLLIVVWGIDAWLLHQSNGVLPWAKAAFAAACILLPFSLLGWLSTRLRSVGLAAFLWLLAGVAFGWFAAQIAFRFFPWILTRGAPEMARFIAYDYGVGPSTRATLSSILCGLVFFLAGLTSSGLQESASEGVYPVTRAFSMAAWVGLFALTGLLVDDLINRPLRTPVVIVDELISFRVSAPEAMGTPEARRRRANVLNPIDDLLPRRRRLVMAGYDDTVTLSRVLVDFDGIMVECTLITTEPVFCETLE